jgi:hypothetical protein
MILGVVDAIRRNHALEHGTVMIMLGRLGPKVRLVGRATPDGFYIYGNVPTDVLTACAHEALARFHGGEASLAITPLCGTNIAVGGVLSGLGAALALGRRPTAARLPNAFSAAATGIVIAQPVGRLVQKFLTTRADLGEVEIVGVRRGWGGKIHKVQTRRVSAITAPQHEVAGTSDRNGSVAAAVSPIR